MFGLPEVNPGARQRPQVLVTFAEVFDRSEKLRSRRLVSLRCEPDAAESFITQPNVEIVFSLACRRKHLFNLLSCSRVVAKSSLHACDGTGAVDSGSLAVSTIAVVNQRLFQILPCRIQLTVLF